MAYIPTNIDQYLIKFGEQSIHCDSYALRKLGIDRSRCFLKIEGYQIPCMPIQLGFKRCVFMASLSGKQIDFFKKYANSIVGLSIAFNPLNKPDPIKFYLHCTLQAVGQTKNNDNACLFILDMKNCPKEMLLMLGNFLENHELIKSQYEDYGKNAIQMKAETAKLMGYNSYATITGLNPDVCRIQIYSISSKEVVHLEAEGAPARPVGASVNYQFFFRKCRVSVTGTIAESSILSEGIVRTKANLAFCPELVEILDDYWYNYQVKMRYTPPGEDLYNSINPAQVIRQFGNTRETNYGSVHRTPGVKRLPGLSSLSGDSTPETA